MLGFYSNPIALKRLHLPSSWSFWSSSNTCRLVFHPALQAWYEMFSCVNEGSQSAGKQKNAKPAGMDSLTRDKKGVQTGKEHNHC
jgi:hypothetical protein